MRAAAGRTTGSSAAVLQLLVALALLACALAIGYGASVETFSIELGGLVGAVMGPEHASHSYSVLSLGRELPHISRRASPAARKLTVVRCHWHSI